MSARALRACGRSFGDAARARLVPVKTVRPIWAELHMTLRERMGREASPWAEFPDSQSIKSAKKGR